MIVGRCIVYPLSPRVQRLFALWFRAFTEAAVAREELTVVESTPAGSASWRGGVLTRLAASGYEVAVDLLTYRHAAKRITFLDTWLELAEQCPDDRVYASYNTARARTGRLTSSDPNHQQVARDLKPVYRSCSGWPYFVEIDYAQAEMRIMAEYIHRFTEPDNPMLEAYINDYDLHKMNAALVHGRDWQSTTKPERQSGKAVGFGFLFGMFPKKFVQVAAEDYGVEFTLPQAERVRTAFYERWTGLGAFHTYQEELVREQGYVTNLFGRKRRLPDVYSEDFGTANHAQRQAINFPIQSTASDMMLHALGDIRRMGTRDVRPVGTVHDSLLLEVRDLDRLDDICYSLLHPPINLTVPLEVEVSIGSHWGDYQEVFTRRTQ